jgi:hypothetical protein
VSGFYVYVITFDQDTFGIFATREAAEESLRQQIAQGGPEPRFKGGGVTPDEIVAWLRQAPTGDVAFVLGAAVQLIAMEQGVTEAELYAEFAKRASGEPDANVIRQRFLDGHVEVASNRESNS